MLNSVGFFLLNTSWFCKSQTSNSGLRRPRAGLVSDKIMILVISCSLLPFLQIVQSQFSRPIPPEQLYEDFFQGNPTCIDNREPISGSCWTNQTQRIDYTCRYSLFTCPCCGEYYTYLELGRFCTRFCKEKLVEECLPPLIKIPLNFGDEPEEKECNEEVKIIPQPVQRPRVQPTAPTSTTGPQFSSTNPTNTRPHNAVIFPDDVEPSTTTTIRDSSVNFGTAQKETETRKTTNVQESNGPSSLDPRPSQASSGFQPGLQSPIKQPGFQSSSRRIGSQSSNRRPGSQLSNRRPGSPSSIGSQSFDGESGYQLSNGQPGYQLSNGQPGFQASNGKPAFQASNEQSELGTFNGQSGFKSSNELPGSQSSNRQPGLVTSNGQSGSGTSNGQPVLGTSNGQPGLGTSDGQPVLGTSNGQPVLGISNEQSESTLFKGTTETTRPQKSEQEIQFDNKSRETKSQAGSGSASRSAVQLTNEEEKPLDGAIEVQQDNSRIHFIRIFV
ncbi:cell wall protein RBR3 isoform X1 [Eurytemora carolleeae]|uniref:cell wall protein RBR3 isoform X1 n=1 Tax=Eurytemora carolleeae TaxID=1294199 RepID=UPI000C777D35|nr:cell wall protein RBR3 isoform X1 [Eurytemora carolleeae]|eukprot:XP_023341877.1 cell wall protein RBR3-like isoform X1 [Eurytemora affinis]